MFAEDDKRWYDERLSKKTSDYVWFFDPDVERSYSYSTSDRSGIVWRLTPICHLHSFNRTDRKHHKYPLHFKLCTQIAVLDLEYRTNVESPDPVCNHIAGYLGRLRHDLLEELSLGEKTSNELWQPDSLRPWAVRTHHGFGHCASGRESYLEKCLGNSWKPCLHDEPTLYGRF